MGLLNSERRYHYFVVFLLVIHGCVAPPTKEKKDPGEAKTSGDDKPVNLDDLGLEYNRYLKEVVEALESDPDFRKKLETAEEADFRNGKVAAELEYVSHHVRTKLDELKRTELERLRYLVKQAEELEKNEVNPNHVDPQHIDHANPHTFEAADLHKLITQVRKDLSEADRKRREEFKEYELQKKFESEQKIKAMDEEHRNKFLAELEEQKKKHAQHQPLHHPGSKAQLEEVWEKEDQMKNQEFNPKTFFLLHDINGDGYWDEDEVKALFLKELDKLYQAGVPEDDMREREEEMERMREHVFKESDTNEDRLISYAEFLEQTKKKEFNRDEGWETIDSQPQFTQQEYEEFERRRQEEIQHMIDQGLLQPYAPGIMPPPPQQFHPGMQGPGYGQHMPPHGNVQHMPPHGNVQYAAGHGQYAAGHGQYAAGHGQYAAGHGQYAPASPNMGQEGQHQVPQYQMPPQHHQQPSPNAIPQQHQQPSPNANPQQHQPSPNAIPQQHQQPSPNAIPQQHQPPSNAIPQQHQQPSNAIHQQPSPNVIPQQHQQPSPNAIPQHHQAPSPNAVHQQVPGQQSQQQQPGQHKFNSMPSNAGQIPNTNQIPPSYGKQQHALPPQGNQIPQVQYNNQQGGYAPQQPQYHQGGAQNHLPSNEKMSN